LPARYVIHTVGPVARGESRPDAEALAACYRNSLLLASSLKLRSIAFPAISTGAYGYPRDKAAPVVSKAIETALREPVSVEDVRIVFFDQGDAEIFLRCQRFGLE